MNKMNKYNDSGEKEIMSSWIILVVGDGNVHLLICFFLCLFSLFHGLILSPSDVLFQ